MGEIFDGIQRPLETIGHKTGDVFIPRGVDVQPLDETRKWQFTPTGIREGSLITGGDIFGTVYENELVTEHKIMCPPNVYGKVVKVYGGGTDGKDQFDITETVLEVYARRAAISRTIRGAAAAARFSAETSRGGAAPWSWIVRGGRGAAGAAWIVREDDERRIHMLERRDQQRRLG